MRLKVLEFFSEGTEEEILLGLDMMKQEGIHFLLIPKLWVLHFSPESPKALPTKKVVALAKDLIPQWLDQLPSQVSQFLKGYIDGLKYDDRGPRYGLFRGDRFFELLLDERVVCMEELVHLWKKDDFYWEKTDLTQFLLLHSDKFDKNGFIDARMKYRDLHCRRIKVLFETNDRNFDQEKFFSMYLKGSKLDLFNTGIQEVPPVFFTDKAIKVLEIRGTEITQLPISFVNQLHTIKARNVVKESLTEKKES